MNLLSKTNPTSKRIERILATIVSILLLAACFGAATFSLQVVRAANPSDAQPFVGTWEGEFQGHTFVVLKLRVENGKLAGTAIHTESIGENDKGEITKVADKSVPGTITEANISGKSMKFTIADENDPSHVASFEFKITGPNEAEMNPVHQPQNSIVTRPWKMKRTTRGS